LGSRGSTRTLCVWAFGKTHTLCVWAFGQSDCVNTDFFVGLLIKLPVLFLSITVHEFAHAFSAFLMGDTTARDQGRLSLNPIDHLDPVGTLCMVFGFFGWAKPVPIDPSNADRRWKRTRRGQKSDTFDPRYAERFTMLTGFAGPASNLILAVVFALLLRGLLAFGVVGTTDDWSSFFGQLHGMHTWQQVLCHMLSLAIGINIALALFNLLPLGPLDGHHILPYFLPHKAKVYFHWLNQYGMYILLGLFLLPQVIPGADVLWWLLYWPQHGFTWLIAGTDGQQWVDHWSRWFWGQYGSLRAPAGG
jgi:Zn-dependent protease